MLEILKFIFQDFGHWLGFVTIIAITLEGIAQIFMVVNKKDDL